MSYYKIYVRGESEKSFRSIENFADGGEEMQFASFDRAKIFAYDLFSRFVSSPANYFVTYRIEKNGKLYHQETIFKRGYDLADILLDYIKSDSEELALYKEAEDKTEYLQEICQNLYLLSLTDEEIEKVKEELADE